MATTKQSLFPEGQVALAAFAGALAHPARIAIIGLLQAREEACCGEIVKALPLAQATVSQHLQVLNRVGLLHLRPAFFRMRQHPKPTDQPKRSALQLLHARGAENDPHRASRGGLRPRHGAYGLG
ncbi:MAG: helix-turn-helix transcriptional regulator [Puniceicoccaceae bacterium]|nr:helix-turn-helix transcriptional regulator [Puniceicoccaceae bacterium]MBL6912079.1 helix-turn-helix transcriptional regulator [Puniceicoccaceae bacterium]